MFRRSRTLLYVMVLTLALSLPGLSGASGRSANARTTYDVRYSVSFLQGGASGSVSAAINGTFGRIQPLRYVSGRTLHIDAQNEGGGPVRPGHRISATVRFDFPDCQWTKTYRVPARHLVSATVVLGFKPTRARSAGVFEAIFLPLRSPDPDLGYQCRELAGVGLEQLLSFSTKVKLPGLDGFFDWKGLSGGLNMEIKTRQTENRLSFPLNRLWAGKSFLVTAKQVDKAAQLLSVPNVSLHSRSSRPQSAWLCGKQGHGKGHGKGAVTVPLATNLA